MNYEGPLQSHAHWYGELGTDRYQGKEFRMNWMQGCFGLRPIASLFVHLYWRYGDQIDFANVRPGKQFQINPSFTLNLGLHMQIEIAHTF